jgi:hypothetical protein
MRGSPGPGFVQPLPGPHFEHGGWNVGASSFQRVLRGDHLARTPPIWTWEIQRRPKPLGVKLSGVDFKTESAAKLAGEKALMEFLDRLADEEGNAV